MLFITEGFNGTRTMARCDKVAFFLRKSFTFMHPRDPVVLGLMPLYFCIHYIYRHLKVYSYKWHKVLDSSVKPWALHVFCMKLWSKMAASCCHSPVDNYLQEVISVKVAMLASSHPFCWINYWNSYISFRSSSKSLFLILLRVLIDLAKSCLC